MRLQNKGFVVCTTAFRVHPERKDAVQSVRPKPQRRTAPVHLDVAKRTMRVAVTTFLRATKRFSRAFKRIPMVMQSRERLLTVFCPSIVFFWSLIPVDDAVRSTVLTLGFTENHITIAGSRVKIITKAPVTVFMIKMDRVLAALNAAVQQHS